MSNKGFLGEYIHRILDRKGGKSAGWHPSGLAKKAGISPGYMNYLIRGESSGKKGPPSPTIEMIFSLAKALGVSWEHLILAYDGIDPDIEYTQEKIGDLDKFRREIIEEYLEWTKTKGQIQ